MNSVQLTVKTKATEGGMEENRLSKFDFEKLSVYQRALEFLDEVFLICKTLPKYLLFSLGSQFIRAALSISNNLAEGTGKQSKKEKVRYYSTAIDSTRECISILNVMIRQNHIEKNHYEKLRTDSRNITGMLYNLIASVHRKP